MNIINPIAQSFYVAQESGIYATSLDLYFYSKDRRLPVTVQLRPMEFGYPSKKVYPFGEVVLKPKNVVVSDTATEATRVTFESPVFLEGGKFHSIVIISPNTTAYKVFVSELGKENIIDTDDETKFPSIVTKQPLSGGLFKSQSSSSWNEEPYEDLKFTLYRANFTSNIGNVLFFNPKLSAGNKQVATLIEDPFEMVSRKIKVTTSLEVEDTLLLEGNTIYQTRTGASGNYVGLAGSATGTLGLINAGIGYTPLTGSVTYTDVDLISLTGDGKNATADITISNGVAIASTITSGGSGYSVGDVLTAEINSGAGRNLKLSLSALNGSNQIIIDDVQGEFITGIGYTLQFSNSLNNGEFQNINSGFSTDIYIQNDGLLVINDGLHIKVNHRNHGMNSNTDIVQISEVSPDTTPKILSTRLSRTESNELRFSGGGGISLYSNFENVSVSSTNPGYVLIDDEIISYTGVTENSLTGLTRGIDSTPIQVHRGNTRFKTQIFKYELNGISLRRINKNHNLSEVTVQDAIDLDYYHIKIDTSQDGKTDPLPNGQVDRSVNAPYPKLYINETKSTGGSEIEASQNIQFTLAKPIIETSILPGTQIRSTIRTVAGRSVDGSEPPYEDKGFEPFDINGENYFDSPRAIYSNVNEQNRLSNLPGKKSMSVFMEMRSNSQFISPVIDMDRVGMVLVSNRVNNKIQNYAEDGRVSTMEDDPSAFNYATKTISLEVPATTIKLYMSAYINVFGDIRALYSIKNNIDDEDIYYPFPGYKNLDSIGNVIDEALNDGTPDTKPIKTDILDDGLSDILFKEYEFTANVESFKYFSIKLIGSSTNQSYPPLVKDLRVVAVA